MPLPVTRSEGTEESDYGIAEYLRLDAEEGECVYRVIYNRPWIRYLEEFDAEIAFDRTAEALRKKFRIVNTEPWVLSGYPARIFVGLDASHPVQLAMIIVSVDTSMYQFAVGGTEAECGKRRRAFFDSIELDPSKRD